MEMRKENRDKQKGILIVSFGTTYQDTREKNIDEIVKAVREKFPDCEVRQAYSSDKIRKILEKKDGIIIPDTEEALKQMKQNGIKQVVILPTHIIDGVENNKVKQIAKEYESEFETLIMAGALLEHEEDYAEVAKALWDSIVGVVQERIVIFMGHGSYHKADTSYKKMEQALREYAGREIYIATVEGQIKIEDIIGRIRQKNSGILLLPFMSVAGEHARNDMAGEGKSFLTELTEAGYETECMLCGIGEYEKIREIYIKHLIKAEKDVTGYEK